MKNENSDKRRFLVVLADRKIGRFFTIYQNNFEDEGGEIVDDTVPQKIKTEGWRIGKVDGHIRDHLFKHLRLIGKMANEYAGNKPINGVIVGGHKELLERIKDFLPYPLNRKIIGEFIAKPNRPLSDLTNKAMKSIIL